MRFVAQSVLAFVSLASLGNTLAYGQTADDGLRLETESADDPAALDDVARQAAQPPQITAEENTPPRRRKPVVDPYMAQGIDAGAFKLFPSLEVGTVFASNVRKSSAAKDEDIGLRLKPQLQLQSDWVRHSLKASAALEYSTFKKNDDLESLTGSFGGELTLDVRRDTKAILDASYAATSTGLRASTLPANAIGARVDQNLTIGGVVSHDFGGLEGQLRLDVKRNVYGEVDLAGGGTESNGDRDYTELGMAARASLDTGSALKPYGEVAYVPRLHDERLDRNGIARNSQGLRLTAGVAIADNPLWSADVAAVMELRDYSDSGLGAVLSPGVVSNITWRPTDLTQFEFNSGAGLSETVAAGVAASQTWNIGAKVTHSLRDNLALSAAVSTTLEHASGDTDITTVGAMGFAWTLNPAIVLSAGYEGTFFNGAAAGSDYSDHRIITSVVFRK